jgi:uncharacterized protein YhaN
MAKPRNANPAKLLVATGTGIAWLATVSLAEDPPGLTTESDVRAEISEAMAAVADYAEQERDAALTRARSALDRLDAAIEASEQDLRENWADMSVEARQTARDRMKNLRAARNRLGERYGALKAGSAEAWNELTDGFGSAWKALSDAWEEVGEDASKG